MSIVWIKITNIFTIDSCYVIFIVYEIGLIVPRKGGLFHQGIGVKLRSKRGMKEPFWKWVGASPIGVNLSTAVILSEAKDLRAAQREILRFAQDDSWPGGDP